MGATKALSWTLARLSTWAIHKHEMKLLVVAGRHGTKLTGELIADMLSPDLVVRRQLEKPFWEYSIPLAVLGLEDRRYTPVEWIAVIIRSTLQLLLRPKNSTWTIVQMNTYKDEVARYWSGIIKPEVLVLVHPGKEERELSKLLISTATTSVVVPDDMRLDASVRQRGVSIKTYGEGKDSDIELLSFEDMDNGTRVTIDGPLPGERAELFIFQRGAFMREPVLAAITVLFALSFSLDEVEEKLRQTQLDLERFIFTAPK